MKISLVVPAFNEERLLPGSLSCMRAALRGFDRLGWKSELIVCDNNSTDRTAEIAIAAGAEVVFEPVNQISRARNAGAARAGGDWIFFVDADSHPSVELFREAAGAFSEELYAGEEIDLFRRLKRLARREKRAIVILHRHPLRTSNRKLRLYGAREFFRFMVKTVMSRGRALKSREDCFVWYDGRR